MFFSEHRLKIASLRIGKHRIVKNIASLRKVNIAHPYTDELTFARLEKIGSDLKKAGKPEYGVKLLSMRSLAMSRSTNELSSRSTSFSDDYEAPIELAPIPAPWSPHCLINLSSSSDNGHSSVLIWPWQRSTLPRNFLFLLSFLCFCLFTAMHFFLLHLFFYFLSPSTTSTARH